MTSLQAVLLGLLQGLTEFLPVSSSGHLVIFQTILKFDQPPVVFDILVHLATALATTVVIWPVLIKLSFKKLKLIVFASLPAAFVGFLLNEKIETLFSSVRLVALALIITAGLLYATKFKLKIKSIKTGLSFKNAFLIGLFQSLAIIPGISRSGSTISGGLFTGLKPLTAFDFSFMLSLPAILGAALLQLNKLYNLPSSSFSVFGFGFIAAFFSGLVALKLLKRLVISSKLHYFSYYCFALALLLLAFF